MQEPMAAGVGQRRAVAVAVTGRVRKVSGAGRRRKPLNRPKGCCPVVVLCCSVVGWIVAAAAACPGVCSMYLH